MSARWPRWLCGLGIAAALAAVLAAAALLRLHSAALAAVRESVMFFQTRSPAACATYIVLLAGLVMVGVPLSPLEVFCGFCFGVALGIPLDLAGRLLGSGASFHIARFLASRGWTCPCLAGEQGAAVLRGVGRAAESGGLRFLVLFNLAYVPVAVKNYGLGAVPEVRFALFVASIFIVEVPHATVFATMGMLAAGDVAAGLHPSSEHGLAAAEQRHWVLRALLFLAGLAAVAAVARIVAGYVAAELAAAREAAEEPGEERAQAEAAPLLLGPAPA